jgi:hypothetical protein
MPPTAAEIRVAQLYITEHVDSDLAFLWSSAGVEIIHQYAIGQHYPSLQKFSVLADTRAEVRDICKSDFAMDPASGPDVRASVAAVVAAWESSKDFIVKDNQLKAEAKALGQTRPVSSTDRSAMRRAVEAAFGELDERECPSPDYLASKLEEVELNEPSASSLDDITASDSISVSSIQTSLDNAGGLKIVKTKAKGRLPNTTEELRLKLKIEGNTWLYIASKYRNRAWLNGLTPGCWVKCTEYLLGDKVMHLQIPRSDGQDGLVPLLPSWSVLLGYDLALRKRVMKLVLDGACAISEGLKTVVKDPELKELHFVSPVVLMAKRGKTTDDNSKPSKVARSEDQFSPKGGRGRGKGGRGKGKKGQGKGKNKRGLISRTPDGRSICYAYNNQGCSGNCGMVHVCRICMKDHPMTQHHAKA